MISEIFGSFEKKQREDFGCENGSLVIRWASFRDLSNTDGCVVSNNLQ